MLFQATLPLEAVAFIFLVVSTLCINSALPVPDVSPAASVIVGCVFVNVAPDPITVSVSGEPRAVIAAAELPIVTPVTTAAPVPVVEVAPVATVLAVPNVTFEAVFAVPRTVLVALTSLPFPPPIISVSAASPSRLISCN